jgi:hypothetical protein
MNNLLVVTCLCYILSHVARCMLDVAPGGRTWMGEGECCMGDDWLWEVGS